MSATISLTPPGGALSGTIHLPASKSESNRMLVIRALSQNSIEVRNLSEAHDTQTMIGLLAENPETLDVGHAGTAMRFLTAFLAFRSEDKVLTGSQRMQQRPIGLLVDALRTLGADIHYLDREGYPPLMIFGRNSKFGESRVSIPGNVSSQYISALLMIAPTLPDGLRIDIEGDIGSRPYIEMTLGLMAKFGIEYRWEGTSILVERRLYQRGSYAVEADWSAASYWYCIAAMAEEAEFTLPGLRRDSWQGDHVVAEMMAGLGVETEYSEEGVKIKKVKVRMPDAVVWDFRDCPDLAQGLLVMLAGLGIKGRFTGLESLRIKETDRIAALQQELGKFGMRLDEKDAVWTLTGTFEVATASIPTYQDHRMAMAFAPLALHCPGLQIEESEVVRKSYPGFWEDLKKVGFGVE
jgi:3-phosphoshikimate 1-carboxyvinyltransferase